VTLTEGGTMNMGNEKKECGFVHMNNTKTTNREKIANHAAGLTILSDEKGRE
jgi:hypothetical protein